MSGLDWLPHANAMLNLTAASLLLAARWAVARGQIERHQRLMLCALTVSGLFLVGYLVYHYNFPIRLFRGSGGWRSAYYAVLISHVLLAAMSLPMIAITAALGWSRREAQHRGWARWTWPLWMYVSVSGVLVYLALYHIDFA
jgi:uncharacterized membrane protein YozB (DUF420 family)